MVIFNSLVFAACSRCCNLNSTSIDMCKSDPGAGPHAGSHSRNMHLKASTSEIYNNMNTRKSVKNHNNLKGNSHQKLSVAYVIELLLKIFLVYHSPMFEAWKVPKRPLEVSCDVTLHLVVYQTAAGTRTNSSGMCTHIGQHSRLPYMHTLCLLD